MWYTHPMDYYNVIIHFSAHWCNYRFHLDKCNEKMISTNHTIIFLKDCLDSLSLTDHRSLDFQMSVYPNNHIYPDNVQIICSAFIF